MQIRIIDGRYFDIGGGTYLFNSNYTVNADEGYYRQLGTLLKLGAVEGANFCRVGNKHDGGYIMIDDNFNGGGGSIFLRNKSRGVVGFGHGGARLRHFYVRSHN